MINVLYIFLGLLLFVYFYSLGAYFVLKSLGIEGAKKAFIPFYAFALINRETRVFTVFTIPVRRYMGFVITLFSIIILACLYGYWGNENLPVQSVGPLWEIMIVLILISAICLYVSLINSFDKLTLRFQVEKYKTLMVLNALILPMPFVYYYLSKREHRIL